MKLTDFALIFVGVFLPVVVLVYINTAFVVKAEKQEMYYKNIINSAISDAVSSMKQVENEDEEIDYGYSGKTDKKVSINSNLAISTFYSSLASNFNVKDNEMSLERLKMYIPVIAIMDYDGLYIHSAETDANNEVTFITKPKVHYTKYYVLVKDTNPITYASENKMVLLDSIDAWTDVSGNVLSNHVYEVNFTMDDYVYLNIYEIGDPLSTPKMSIVESMAFYLRDDNNNSGLVYATGILSTERMVLREKVIKELEGMRRETIAEIGMREISYAINKHNDYARATGINYAFRFSVESDATWYETVDGIGMIAVIQGVSLGNRYLNYKAYSAADLIQTKKYHVSKGITIEGKDTSYLARDLYHISDKCRAYLQYKNSTDEKLSPSYYIDRAEAATHGYYPCPVCKP